MMIKNANMLESYETENEVMDKVRSLLNQGVSEENMYVMARDEEQIEYLKRETNIDYKTADGDWIDKFMGFLSGKDATEEAISRMGIGEERAHQYGREVQNGKILLFVDHEAEIEEQENTRTSSNEQLLAGSNGSIGSFQGAETNERKTRQQEKTPSSFDEHLGANSNEGLGAFEGGRVSEKKRVNNKENYETASVGEESGAGFDLGREEEEEKEMFIEGRNYGASDETKERMTNESQGDDEERMQLREERLKIDKENKKIGEVNVEKRIVEEEQRMDVPIEREEVYVERRPVNGELDDHRIYEDRDELSIPINEERLNITKEDVVSEEIVVGKRKIQDTETVNETIQREEADIDETGQNKKRRQGDRDEPLKL